MIREQFIPAAERHVIGGQCHIISRDELFHNALAVDMLIDVLSERGYHVEYVEDREFVPVRFDKDTMRVETEQRPVFRFNLKFQPIYLRKDADGKGIGLDSLPSDL